MWARFSHLFILLVLVTSLTGCGKDDARTSPLLGSGDLRWTSFPIAIKVDDKVLDRGEAEEDLLAAIAFWEKKAGRTLFTLGTWPAGRATFTGPADNPTDLSDNVIAFQSPWPFETRIAGKTVVLANDVTIQKAVIFLNPGTRLCAGYCIDQDTLTSRRKLLAHELGHFIGFAHVMDRENVMFPEILPGGYLDNLKIDEPLLQKLVR